MKAVFADRRADWAVAVLAFCLGAWLDLTAVRLDPASALAGSSLFLAVCRCVGGLILAGLSVALLRALRDMKGCLSVRSRQALLLFFAVNALTLVYLLTSKTVYVWDNAGYWTVARTLSRQWLGRSQLYDVLRSTVTMDYNYLLAWPISWVMRVLGESRWVFVFCVSNLYTLPALLGLCALTGGRKGQGVVLCAAFPALMYVGLVGYVDVAACALAIWAVAVYHSKAPAVSRGVLTGALLVGTFLLRRYFFFFAAAFGVAALAVKLVERPRKWGDFGALFVSCALCAVYFTPTFLLEKVFGTDYGDLYSAYALGLWSDAKLFCRYFGLIPLVLLLLAGVALLCREESRGKALFALSQLGSCYVAFVLVQSHGQQHLLLYVPALALLAAETLAVCPRAGWLAALSMLSCFLPRSQPGSIQEIRGLSPLPTIAVYGPARSDMEELTALRDYVDSLSSQGEKTAVVLASSFTLNDETLTNLRPSLGLREPEQTTTIRYQGTVDKRDPFNWNTLTADYLIVGDPVQTHLGEENQQVITLFARDVLSGEGPGSAYEPLEETFVLEGNVTVRVYRRTRDLTGEEYRLISHRLQALYPEYEALYAVPDWLA